jgi:hypothetical protein
VGWIIASIDAPFAGRLPGGNHRAAEWLENSGTGWHFLRGEDSDLFWKKGLKKIALVISATV